MTDFPIDALAASLHKALLVDLDPLKVEQFEYKPGVPGEKGLRRVSTGEFRDARPSERDCEVTMFVQSWGSTALGFGGVGGQAFTGAYTVIVGGPQGDYCVYFAGRLAYHLRNPSRAFFEDMANHGMAEVARAGKYRKAEV